MAQARRVAEPVEHQLPAGPGARRDHRDGPTDAAPAERRLRALELDRRTDVPTSLGDRLATSVRGAWRWLMRNVRVALLSPGGRSTEVQARPAALRALIRSTRIVLVTTRGDDGTLHSEPMATSDREFDGEVWLASRATAPVIDRLKGRAAVQLTYVDPASTRCVVLDGIARTSSHAGDSSRAIIRVDVLSADVWE